MEHQSAGISTGGSIAGQFAGNMANGMLSGADSSGSAEGTTRAAVENGTVIVRDKANQAQDTAALSRDTENANGSIDAIFDKEKEQRRLDEAQLISDIGSQVSDIARTQGELSGESQSGTGSDIQRAIQAATAAAQGLAGGDMTAALAGAAAPYVAEIIGHRSGLDDGMEKAAAHAVANAVLAAVQGKDALAGAAGAAAGELTGTLALEMYGKDVAALSESEKQTISALATLAAGIAGGLTGDSTASAVAGAQTGKTTVENNSLAHVLAAAEANKSGTVDKWQEEQQAAIKEACSGNTPMSCQMAVAAMGTVMSGGVLPEAMVISGAITAGAVSAIDFGFNGSVDPKNVIAAYWTGVLTRNTGYKSTVVINAASGAITNSIDGKNPFLYGTISGFGSAIGYGIGNKIITPMLDDYMNPTWKALRWDDIGMGMSQPSHLNPIPGMVGTAGGGISGEGFNVIVDPNSPIKKKETTK